MIFGPDWKDFFTPEEAERELKDFEFKGIGWYEEETDTLLVLDKIEGGKNTGRYRFWCWNQPGARTLFADSVSRIIHMPVRT